MKNDNINDIQERFCQNFVQTLNPVKSAIEAGYKKNSARITAWRLLKEPKINERINQIRFQTGIDLSKYLSFDDIVNFHVRILKCDIKDYLEFGVKNNRNYIQLKNSKDVDGQLIQEITQGKDGIRIKLIDKKQSVDFISKLLDKYKLKITNFDKIADVKYYLNDLLLKSCEISESTLRNQLAITGKIIECYKTDQDEKLLELEKMINEILERNNDESN